MRYKVGDKVKIKTWEELKKIFPERKNLTSIRDMCDWVDQLKTNRKVTIKEIRCGEYDDLSVVYLFKEFEGFRWQMWSDRIFEENIDVSTTKSTNRFELMDMD